MLEWNVANFSCVYESVLFWGCTDDRGLWNRLLDRKPSKRTMLRCASSDCRFDLANCDVASIIESSLWSYSSSESSDDDSSSLSTTWVLSSITERRPGISSSDKPPRKMVQIWKANTQLYNYGSRIILSFRLPTQAASATWCTSTCVRISTMWCENTVLKN